MSKDPLKVQTEQKSSGMGEGIVNAVEIQRKDAKAQRRKAIPDGRPLHGW
jgi:hypothetical protein